MQSTDAKKVITVRTASFAAAGAGGSAATDTVAAAADPALSTFKGEEIVKSDRPELTRPRSLFLAAARSARRRISPNISSRWPTMLGAAMGARARLLMRAMPRMTGRWPDRQGGRAGPVYAAGISGAIQHLAGMKDSKVIVAINKDEEAPIFQVADYGLVGDLFTILPELEKAL